MVAATSRAGRISVTAGWRTRSAGGGQPAEIPVVKRLCSNQSRTVISICDLVSACAFRVVNGEMPLS